MSIKNIAEPVRPLKHEKALTTFNRLMIDLKLFLAEIKGMESKAVNLDRVNKDSEVVRKALETCKESRRLKY